MIFCIFNTYITYIIYVYIYMYILSDISYIYILNVYNEIYMYVCMYRPLWVVICTLNKHTVHAIHELYIPCICHT